MSLRDDMYPGMLETFVWRVGMLDRVTWVLIGIIVVLMGVIAWMI